MTGPGASSTGELFSPLGARLAKDDKSSIDTEEMVVSSDAFNSFDAMSDKSST